MQEAVSSGAELWQVAMARLFIKGRDYGPHAFVVPIRDMGSHLPLPGIKVGDIGPKFGYNGVDNGFLSFNHVRVPLDHMLMRFAKARGPPVTGTHRACFNKVVSPHMRVPSLP